MNLIQKPLTYIAIVCLMALVLSYSTVAYSPSSKVDGITGSLSGINNINLYDTTATSNHEQDGQKNNLRTHVSHQANVDMMSLIQNIDESLYLSYLENITSFGPRLTSTPSCDASGKYIYHTFEDMGIDVRYQNWSNDYYYGSNIEGSIQGADETSDEIYIICAHYDTVDGSPGADDDASGVAAVLTAADVMSQYSFNHTVRFIAFSGEEEGLYGSYYYAQEAVENNDNIVSVFNVDMIGFAISENDKSKIKVYEDEFSTWLTDYTIDINAKYDQYINLDVVPSGFSRGSDHYRFWEVGYNAIFFAEYNFNDFYHSPEDIIENMNISYATRVTKLITVTLAELAQSYLPVLEISEVDNKLFSLDFEIRNTGKICAEEIEYVYTITGGSRNLIDIEHAGTMKELDSDCSAHLKILKLISGFGYAELELSVQPSQGKTAIKRVDLYVYGCYFTIID